GPGGRGDLGGELLPGRLGCRGGAGVLVGGVEERHSHSMVPGGFDVTSRATRFTPSTSLMTREAMRSTRAYGRRAQSAVMASPLFTARLSIGEAYARPSPITPTVRTAGMTAKLCHSSR